jgi:ribonuclease BN (tRNA processing enzyme)
VRITVLGKSPAWPDAGGACSGYLVQDGDTCLLVDCGSGVFSKLRATLDYADVDAVVISHLHADHLMDLIPFGTALQFSPREPGVRPRLIVPPRAGEVLGVITAALSQSGVLDEAFAMTEYDPADTVSVGPLSITFQPVPHYVPANAVEVCGTSGGRFTFGADHGPTDALNEFAKATDLLFLEATLREPEADGPRGHMTAGEAGVVAAGCDAQRLVLTHISDELDPGWAISEAQRAYDGPVEVAREGAVYDV